MTATTTIRFEIFTTRTRKDGLAPIRIVYSLKGQKKYIPTGQFIWPGFWDVKAQKAIYLNLAGTKALIKKKTDEGKRLPETDLSLLPMKKDLEVLNANLAAMKQKLRAIESNFELNNKSYRTQEVIDIFNAKEDEAPKAIEAQPKIFIADFIKIFAQNQDGIVKPRTLATYTTLAKHLHNFGVKKADRLTFTNLDRERLTELHKYFIKQGLNNTSISKQFSILKTLIKAAIRENKGLEVCHDFRDYTITRKDADYEVIALEQHEFDAIMDLDLSDGSKKEMLTKTVNGQQMHSNVSHKSLEKVRDLFLFSCTTGLRYSDLADLKRVHLRDNWIYKKAVKTGQHLEIPLNAISHFILEKYKNQINPLPVISNQKANDYLKVLGRIAGIDGLIEKRREYGTKEVSTLHKKYELMSMHMGRRVFASLSLQKGTPSQDVMSLTGHKKFASFKRYMNITKAQKQKAMQVWGEIEQPTFKTSNAS